MYCGEGMGRPEMVQSGLVEGRQVKGILLDIGCSRTLVWQDLAPWRRGLVAECPLGVHMEM